MASKNLLIFFLPFFLVAIFLFYFFDLSSPSYYNPIVTKIISPSPTNFLKKELSKTPLEKKAEEEIEVSLIVGDKTYQVKVPASSTVYHTMEILSRKSDFKFEGREFSGLGFFVEKINNIAQNPKEGKYWIYYVNGQLAPVGVSNYFVKDGDVIEWKYEKLP